MPPDPPVFEIVASIRRGDRGAFEQLFRSWYAALVNYAAQIAPSTDSAEDVVQEVFISVWNNRISLPDPDKVGAYLYRAVRNRALNQLRGRRGEVSLDASDVQEPHVEPAIDAALADADLGAAVRAALTALSPRAREVFLLSREQDLTYNEIADTLGISVKTVETLMGRALGTLRTTLLPKVMRDT